GVVLATFVLALKAFGPRVAAWSLVPLAFASTGLLWLSARVTGGHLLTAAWHAGAFALLFGCLTHGGIGRALGLGVWCGLGLYLDRMFLFSLCGWVPAGLSAWWALGRSRRGALGAVIALIGGFAGYLPHEVGVRVDPYDAYHEQFDPLLDRTALVEHARILGMECLPRLVLGHRRPDLASEPSAGLANGEFNPRRGETGAGPIAGVIVALGLALSASAAVALARGPEPPDGVAGAAVRWGLLLSSVAVVA